jgi:hypothetical protein
MGMQIIRKKDKRVIRAFTHKLADIPDGITVSVADFAGKVLTEGTAVGRDATGLGHIIKVAALTADATATATTYDVAKGHDFKTGDVVMLKEGGKASTITAIVATDATKDTITVAATLGVAATVAAGDVLYQADAESTGTASKFKYNPLALVGESYDVEAGSNLVVNAWTIAQIREANIRPLGAAVKAKLTGIQCI